MKRSFFLLLLILLSLPPLLDLLQPGLPLTHDGVDHVARIANFYLSLGEGNIIPRWAANLNWGYGHPILMFLYPLPSYLASAFHFIGFSFVDSTKLVFAVAYVLSGLTMYVWLQSFLSRKAAFIGALAYMFAPYRFVDLYVRGAIGEHVAFIFPPLIFYATFLMSKAKKSRAFIIGSIATAGLLLSHNAISLMFVPFIVLYAFYFFWISRRRRSYVFGIMSFLVLGLCLAAFFWMPAFFEGKYTLRDIVTGDEYRSRFESWSRFLYSAWNYGGTNQFSVQIGLVQLLGIIAAPFTIITYRRQKKDLWILSFIALIFLFITLLFMTNTALPVWEKLTILQKFQFPWRLLSVIVFLSAILLALFVNIFTKKMQIIIVSIFAITLLFANRDYWHAKGYSHFSEAYYQSVYNGTTDTGESAPIWSVRFMEKRAKGQSQVIEGDAQVALSAKTTIRREYRVVANEPSRILENTLYFPGWKVTVNGEAVPLEFQDPRYRGLITYFVPSGKSAVVVTFSETKLRLLSNAITVIAIVVLACYAVYLFSQKIWRHSR